YVVGAGGSHGQLMMRTEPVLISLSMAASASSRTDKMRCNLSRIADFVWRLDGSVTPPPAVRHQNDQQQQQSNTHRQQQLIDPPPAVMIKPWITSHSALPPLRHSA